MPSALSCLAISPREVMPCSRNAATVALLRDGDGGLEVLMGKRATKMDFHGGAWVFPGGRLDDADWELADTNILTAAKYAAAAPIWASV